MEHALDIAMLSSLGTTVATLGVGRYALPVRFRISGRAVECRVPVWVSITELIAEAGEVTLVAATEVCSELRWLFVRGPASIVDDPDWTGLAPRLPARAALAELYQVVRVAPRRIELIDERRGWGYRETADF
ncbi:MAG: hypothetical protein ACM3XN_09100 [Chloroflexota bacterium]